MQILGALFIFIFSNAAPPPFDWSKEALKLTGESDLARENALKKLKRHPKIKKILKAELVTSKKALALDVIGALQDRSFIPDLLKLAPFDETGGFYLTINSMLTPKLAKKVLATYKQRVFLTSQPASQVALLDTLGMVGVPLPVFKLEELLQHPSYEVRGAVISYVRLMVLRHRKKPYVTLLTPALQTSPYQLRLQTVYVLEELGKPYKKLKRDLRALCGQDPNDEVRTACVNRLGDS